MPRELTPQEIAERSLIKTYRKSLWNPFIAAVKRYELVEPRDRIAVCISGGKDSMVLAMLMQELRRHTDQPFDLTFLVMDPGYNAANRALIEENAARLGIPITIFESDIFDVTVQVEKNPVISAPECGGDFCTARPGAGLQQDRPGPSHVRRAETTLLGLFTALSSRPCPQAPPARTSRHGADPAAVLRPRGRHHRLEEL